MEKFRVFNDCVWRNVHAAECRSQLTEEARLVALANHHLATEISWTNRESDRQTDRRHT